MAAEEHSGEGGSWGGRMVDSIKSRLGERRREAA